MIYTNINLSTVELEREWGILEQIIVGESGRGRSFISLPTPKGLEGLKKGLHEDFSIGATKTGRPRIIRSNDPEKLYMILSAEGGYTRRGDGTIWVPKEDLPKYHILAKGNGADGAAGRIGFWECAILEAPIDQGVVRVRTSGAGYGTPADYYVIHERAVYHAEGEEDLEQCVEALNIDIPTRFDSSEWARALWKEEE